MMNNKIICTQDKKNAISEQVTQIIYNYVCIFLLEFVIAS